MSSCAVRGITLLGAAVLTVFAMPAAARADDGDDSHVDARIERSCTAQSRIRLRVRSRDDAELRVDVDVRTARRAAGWTVVIVHERRLEWRTRRRTGARSGSFSLRTTLPDWPGRDTVTVRAIGPRGEICRASVAMDEQTSD
jgi:hypothetical protein